MFRRDTEHLYNFRVRCRRCVIHSHAFSQRTAPKPFFHLFFYA